MGSWTSLGVLALAVASTLSFPHPESAYKIPTVGGGHRAQYYVLHSDGTYKYGYDTADGIFEQAMAKTPGRLSGEFGYKDPTGTDVKLEYTADERGFIARGAHLPVAPEATVPEHAAPSVYKAPDPAPQPAAAPAPTVLDVAQLRSGTSVSAVPSTYEVAQVSSSSGDDGSYSFSYETSGSSRSESGDANNAVSGRYSYVTNDGVDHRIEYVAGADTGYIARGDSLPVGPPVPGAESGIPTGHIVPVLSEEEANALAGVTYTAVVPDTPVLAYSADASPRDASYSFNYDAGDSSRSESADANLNIKGSYSFLPPDLGQRLTVNYIAGSETGFVAEGDHLPKISDDFGSKLTDVAEPISSVLTKAAPPSLPAPAASAASPEPAGSPVITYSAPSDASYSFSYDAGDSSRSESADSNLNIKGTYSFVPPGESHRYSVKYVAGSDTGFVAEGDHLPVPPEPATVAITKAAPSSPSAPSASPEPAGSPVITYSAGDSPSDASYSFSYDAGDSSRSESADSSLNVKGSYSFVPPDGSHRFSVKYVAGSDTGFVAEGDHLPVPPDPTFGSELPGAPEPAAPVPATPSLYKAPHTAPQPAAGPAPTVLDVAQLRSGTSVSAVPSTYEMAQVSSSSGDDGSYSFSYETSGSSRSESGDANNAVNGRYSYVTNDGVDHRIEYVAGADTGYIARGDSLPVGPPVPGAESGIPTGHIVPVLSEEEANALAGVTYTAVVPDTPVLAYSADASPRDASYSFNYDAGDSSRSESADANLNIKGSYSFLPPDLGQRLTVNYIAGSETGFVAEGDHLPKVSDDFGSKLAVVPDSVSTVLTKAAPAVYKASDVSEVAAVPAVIEAVEVKDSHHPVGHSTHVVGNVLLHQYASTNADKYGYVFTALDD